jgi:DNA-binding NarL/FixJ family response regulator
LGKKISKPVVRHPGFSPRELEVLNLLGKGLSRHEIAKQLSISEKTVSTYQAILMEKLKADKVMELIRYAIDEGLVD